MTTTNNLDALFADAEPLFGHPGRRFDDTPEGFDPSPLVDQEPEWDYTPDEGTDAAVHHGGGNAPLCGNDSMTAVYTDDPAAVGGCGDCLELVAEDVQGPHRLLRPLPPLLAGDHRPGRGGVAPDGPPALPALRSEGVVKMREGLGWDRLSSEPE